MCDVIVMPARAAGRHEVHFHDMTAACAAGSVCGKGMQLHHAFLHVCVKGNTCSHGVSVDDTCCHAGGGHGAHGWGL